MSNSNIMETIKLGKPVWRQSSKTGHFSQVMNLREDPMGFRVRHVIPSTPCVIVDADNDAIRKRCDEAYLIGYWLSMSVLGVGVLLVSGLLMLMGF